ncbi:MAG: mechanosensitive ion channel family protein [Candidatus Marinimicrobia bacterium]|nr:mechanosensitive ion channel family protein [Candidatus Neomarinimicrobiota bacterium]
MEMLNSIREMSSTTGRVLVILFLAIVSHGLVMLVKLLSKHVSGYSRAGSKIKSLASLTNSFLVFGLYFGAFGLILRELGVSLTAYLASASVVGLAIAFGFQGLVQDVVTGLTLVLTDLIDVGNMVEIGGQTGVVRSIGMRFIVLENAMGAEVYIPNRSIMNVINYPRGYIRCLVDVSLSIDPGNRDKMLEIIEKTTSSFAEQLPGVQVKPLSMEGVINPSPEKTIYRIKFRIWPGRGLPIETLFRQELVQRMKLIDASYSDWMVSVNYEVEKARVK